MAQNIGDGVMLMNPEAENAIQELKTLIAYKDAVRFDTCMGAIVLLARAIIEIEEGSESNE